MKNVKIKKGLFKKPKTRKFTSVILLFALIITGIFAFLSATDSKNNVFTVGSVNIDLVEKFDTNQNKTIEDDEIYKDVQPPRVENILPGQTIIKEPWVENTGSNDAWIYIVVSVPTATSEEIASNSLRGEEIEVIVRAFAIQDIYKQNNTLEDVWDAYGYDFGGVNRIEETEYNREELFEILHYDEDELTEGFNLTDWIQLDFLHGDDNNNYYVFGYNSLLYSDNIEDDVVPSEITEPVFNAVKLIDTIGQEIIEEPEVYNVHCDVMFFDINGQSHNFVLSNLMQRSSGETVSIEDVIELDEVWNELLAHRVNALNVLNFDFNEEEITVNSSDITFHIYVTEFKEILVG